MSADKTALGKHFFQAQTNVTHGEAILNNTYDYGIAEHWELGANWFDIPLSSISDLSQDEEVLVNIQYFRKLSSVLQLSLGTQTGIVSTQQNDIKFAQLFFLNSQWQLPGHIRAVFGLLKGSPHFMHSDSIIFQLGVEVPIIHEQLHFVSDYISGKTENSVGVMGFAYFLNPEWTLSAGFQYPAENNGRPAGIVLELTYVQK